MFFFVLFESVVRKQGIASLQHPEQGIFFATCMDLMALPERRGHDAFEIFLRPLAHAGNLVETDAPVTHDQKRDPIASFYTLSDLFEISKILDVFHLV